MAATCPDSQTKARSQPVKADLMGKMTISGTDLPIKTWLIEHLYLTMIVLAA